MRLLLTGATGLIGQAMRAEFATDHEIITLGRHENTAVRLDLADSASITSAALPPADVLIHCAGVVDEDFREDPERAFRMALFGADKLARKALDAGVSKLIYLSSAHVYGPMVGHIDESSAINPVSDYAIAHLATEQVFRRLASSSVGVLALRPCAVFGQLRAPQAFRRWSLIPFAFPKEAAKNRKIVIRSTGEQRRNFVGTRDISGTARAWLQTDPTGWQAINPLGSLSASVFQFAQLCAQVSDELLDGNCQIERVTPNGKTAGDDFDYASRSPIAQGHESPAAFARGFIQQLLALEMP